MSAPTPLTLTPAPLGTAFLLLVLTGCGYPLYEQTSASQSAFAFADTIRAGSRNDLPKQARAAGLVASGVCREVGGERLYCNALKVTGTSVGGGYGAFLGPNSFGFNFEELRMCLAPSGATGFVSGGYANIYVPLTLYREYPDEFISLLSTDDLSVGDREDNVSLQRFKSITALPLEAAIRRMGYVETGSEFDISNLDAFPDQYYVRTYPPHEPAERACRSL